jgi:hypothetical protein
MKSNVSVQNGRMSNGRHTGKRQSATYRQSETALELLREAAEQLNLAESRVLDLCIVSQIEGVVQALMSTMTNRKVTPAERAKFLAALKAAREQILRDAKGR